MTILVFFFVLRIDKIVNRNGWEEHRSDGKRTAGQVDGLLKDGLPNVLGKHLFGNLL